MFGLIITAIAVLGTIKATISDLKTREISNELNGFLIVSGLGLRLIYSIYKGDYSYIAEGLVVGTIFFIIGAFLFYTRQWGGGDGKLLIGLGCLLGNFPRDLYKYMPIPGYPRLYNNPDCILPHCIPPQWPFMVSLILNIMLVGAVYGFFATIIIGLRKKETIRKLRKKLIKDETEIIVLISALILLFCVTEYIFTGKITLSSIKNEAHMFFAVIFIWILIKFAKIVETDIMIRKIPLSELREDDWIAEDIIIDGKLITGKRDTGITQEQIELLKKYRDKGKFRDTIKIKEGLPFAPVFPIALILSLTLGDITFLIVEGFLR